MLRHIAALQPGYERIIERIVRTGPRQIRLSAIVLTNNTAQFARVKGLKVENWLRG